MKKVALGLLILLILCQSAVFAHAPQEITILVDGQKVNTDVAPFIQDNRIYVPARFVAEALGAKVEYNSDAYPGQNIIITPINDDFLWLTLFVGHRRALVSEAVYKFDVPPIIVKNRTMIPIRFIASYLGCKVSWNGKTKTVSLESPNSQEHFDNTYYDDIGAEKVSQWLMSQDHDPQKFLNIMK